MSDLEKIEALMASLSPTEQETLMVQVEDYRAALERETAQGNFMAYIKMMWPGFIHGRHHAVMAKKFEAIANGTLKRLIINMPPRHAIETSMKIPTLSGMKTMVDILVGDFVFGPNGKPTEVLGKSEVFKSRKLYRVTTDDGASLVVDGEHLWTVRLDRKRGNWRDYTTEDLWLRQNGWMVRRMPNGSVQKIRLKDQKEVRLPMLPPVQPVEYESRNLAIDPYVLGVWLGDGSRSSAVITCHDAVYTRAEFEKRGYTTTDQATRFTFGVLNLQVKLKELGVYKNKHIPREYLEASALQRRDLLKGLMDTDGNISKAGQCFFAQSNRDFIEQVAELIRSLGIKANILESEAKIGEKSYGKTWKISFYASDIFTLPRKEERTLKGERKFGRYIKVEALEDSGDTQCIKVNRDDGLFLAGEGYICTHNTKSEFASYLLPSWFLGRYPNKKIIQSSNTGDLAVNFGRKVRNLVDSEMYAKVFPGVALRQDSKAAGRWATNQNGEYFAIGVGGTVTGKGADLLIIDDPHALPVGTEVPTPQGFKRIGDLRVGDEVYGPDGIPTKVVAKSEVWEGRELYALTTDDGEVTHCDGGHLWTYHTETALANAHLTKTATARDLAAWGKPNKPYLPRHAAVQYPEKPLPVPPYVLGAWLGDGTTGLNRMTAQPEDSLFMRDQFHRAGFVTTTHADPYSFGVRGLRAALRGLGVLDDKHVPESYLTASTAQRLALLQGLMDTDGNVTAQGECSFNNTNLKLASAVRELLHSLGVKAKLRTYTDKRPNHSPVHRVNFKLADCCRMPRKAERTFTPTDKRRRSFRVEKTAHTSSVQCITVDREDGLFLVGRGYVVTHNSEQEASMAAGDPSVFDKTYEWYTSGPRQRLQPGGAIVIVMCMTGDTNVLLADGGSTHLKDIRPGDMVATFDNGRLGASKVNNWRSSGVDSIYTVQTQSGVILRANERHPFLAMNEGVLEWTRLSQLRVGDELVSLKGAADPLEQKQNPGYSATTATSQLDMARRQMFSNELRRISDFTTDPIISITPSGVEEVFDVEIDRTENFIANGVVSHNTRWGDRDLTGRVIKDATMRDQAEEWEVIEFPAIMPSGNPLWPEFWSFKELSALREELPPSKWNAQYQQAPTGEEGAMVKREWWKIWNNENPPPCEFIIQSWDTAFTKNERSDYSACTTWGVFYMDGDVNNVNVILLDAFQKRMEFPELKERALAAYQEWEPDACIIEAKAAGAPLIFELRKIGVMVSEYTPSRGNDKFVRLNSVTDMFRSGKVWAPETRWASEVVEQMASFPMGDHDDLVDSSTQALIRFRQGGFLRLESDEREELKSFRRKHSYY